MRLLAIPNFSTPALPAELPLPAGLRLHYAQGDVDHGRAVVAFSGPPGAVIEGALTLARELLPHIDLEAQAGAHPRVGALDVAPFVAIDLDEEEALAAAREFGERFASEFAVPVHLYERSAPGRRLPDLRRPGAEPPTPEFGPVEPHLRWGRTVVGVRGFLIAANLDFPASRRAEVRAAARELRRRREAGEAALVGVRALAFDLPSRDAGRGEAQLSFNLTRPDESSFDAVAEISEGLVGARALRAELIGVIRPQDLPRSTRLPVAPPQIVV